jgi:hypothetical protein
LKTINPGFMLDLVAAPGEFIHSAEEFEPPAILTRWSIVDQSGLGGERRKAQR